MSGREEGVGLSEADDGRGIVGLVFGGMDDMKGRESSCLQLGNFKWGTEPRLAAFQAVDDSREGGRGRLR